jgi:hypothetical protein
MHRRQKEEQENQNQWSAEIQRSPRSHVTEPRRPFEPVQLQQSQTLTVIPLLELPRPAQLLQVVPLSPLPQSVC